MRSDAAIYEPTLGGAYRQALGRYLMGQNDGHLVVSCFDPVNSVTVPDSNHVDAWDLNLGKEFEPFSTFDLGKKSDHVAGSTGIDWINDRIVELYDGMYAERLSDPDQIEMIVERLQKGMHGACTNALVAQVFQEEDLDRATVARPSNRDMACMTQLQFRPNKDRLDLHMTLRSQYIDLKGFGNLVAAATLLTKVCERTGYNPGILVEHLNNVTAYDSQLPEEIYEVMSGHAIA